MIDLSGLYEPSSEEAYNALLEDVRAHGFMAPVVMTKDNRIIDGHTRWRIGEEIGKLPSIKYVNVESEADAVGRAVAANAGRGRSFNRQQETEVVELLIKEGWSMRRIAAVLGISPRSAHRASAATGATASVAAKAEGRDGKSRPRRSATAAELRRRREHSATLYRQGYNQQQIAEALGVSRRAIGEDLRASSIPTGGSRRPLPKPPGPVKWRDGEKLTPLPKPQPLPEPLPEPPKVEHPWRTTRSMVSVHEFTREFADYDFANVLAWRFGEAVEAGDSEWCEDVIRLLERINDQVGRLLRLANDQAYREECRTTNEGRESARLTLPKHSLRVVDGQG